MSEISFKYNCEECKHKQICKHSKINRKTKRPMVYLDMEKDLPFIVEIKCDHFTVDVIHELKRRAPSTDTGVK